MKNVVYLDGKFMPEEKATISIKTHALQYGTGCFEGLRAYYNKKDHALYVFRMEDHYKRLLQSCKILFISLPYSVSELCDITIKLLQQNFSPSDIYIRPVAFKSDHAVGNFKLQSLKDSFGMYTTELKFLPSESGIKTCIVSWTRVTDNMIPPRGKITGSYVNTALAKNDSMLSGFDEGLFMDRNGHIVEGTAENIFIIRDNQIITPPAGDDILEGITRATVMTICKNDLGKDIIERSISRTELYEADEVLLVGTGAEIAPVIEVDHRPVGTGKIGPVAKKIMDIYQKMVHGLLPKYSYYVTKVNPTS